MQKLKERIICEKFMIFGCIILIGVYTGDIIGTFISHSSKIYFSDFWSSIMVIMLLVIILLLTIENHNIHLRLLRETEEKEEKETIKICSECGSYYKGTHSLIDCNYAKGNDSGSEKKKIKFK